jgi:hypothetical protein
MMESSTAQDDVSLHSAAFCPITLRVHAPNGLLESGSPSCSPESKSDQSATTRAAVDGDKKYSEAELAAMQLQLFEPPKTFCSSANIDSCRKVLCLSQTFLAGVEDVQASSDALQNKLVTVLDGACVVSCVASGG